MTGRRLILLYLVILLTFIVLHTAFCINKDCNSFIASKQGKFVFLILIILAGYKNLSLALLLIVLYIALNESDIIEGLDSTTNVNQDEYKKAYRTLFCLKCEDSKNFYNKHKSLNPSIFKQVNNIRNKVGIVYNNKISSDDTSSNDTCNVCDFDCKDWSLKVVEGMTNKNDNLTLTSEGDFSCQTGYDRITNYKECEDASKQLNIPLGTTVPIKDQTNGKPWSFANDDWSSGCFINNNNKIFFNSKVDVSKPSNTNNYRSKQRLVCTNNPINNIKSFITNNSSKTSDTGPKTKAVAGVLNNNGSLNFSGLPMNKDLEFQVLDKPDYGWITFAYYNTEKGNSPSEVKNDYINIGGSWGCTPGTGNCSGDITSKKGELTSYKYRAFYPGTSKWISSKTNLRCKEPESGWPPSGVVENGNGYTKYTDVSSLDECKNKCDKENSFTCNAIAYGKAGCFTYHNCDIIDVPQSWGLSYYVKEYQ